MSDGLTRWFRSKKKKKKDDKGHLPDPPRPARDDLTATAPSAAATARSSLFQRIRIPPEIRRCILIEVLGGNTIHLHRVYEQPRTTKLITGTSTLPPPQSRLASYICPGTSVGGGPCSHAGGPDTPSDDYPHSRQVEQRECCNCSLSKDLLSRCVRPLGWLLACRQAYIEGLEVLYTTNQFHIRGQELLEDLPRFLSPSRLATITTVELLWGVHADADAGLSSIKTDFGIPFRPECGLLPEILPNVRSCYLTFSFYHSNPQLDPMGLDEHTTTSENVFRRVDGMVRKLGRLTDCRVAVPVPWYYVRKEKANGKYVPVWRDLPAEHTSQDDGAAPRHVRDYWVYCERMDVLPEGDAF